MIVDNGEMGKVLSRWLMPVALSVARPIPVSADPKTVT
ncbi:hypothetical protein HMPREF0682_2263 [Propionibacterium acidifaciens F0233]|uniref:Uncharacterized protein n=1 Tax=Propionibacterium acidifaciens F0233 TaxID=553198 RepID=U2QYX7_9ACTN|nr:hypothetical protein HMPREF0682_2263 [Propionibacterium acidifaciens F0233]